MTGPTAHQSLVTPSPSTQALCSLSLSQVASVVNAQRKNSSLTISNQTKVNSIVPNQTTKVNPIKVVPYKGGKH